MNGKKSILVVGLCVLLIANDIIINSDDDVRPRRKVSKVRESGNSNYVPLKGDDKELKLATLRWKLPWNVKEILKFYKMNKQSLQDIPTATQRGIPLSS